MVQPCINDLNHDVHAAMHLCTWLLAFGACYYPTSSQGLAQCDLSVLVSVQAASSHTQTEDSAHTDSQKEQLHAMLRSCACSDPVCLVPRSVDICLCMIALFNRAATRVLRAFDSADIGIINFGSSLDSIACCLMLVAGRPTSQRIFQLSATAQSDATCNKFLHEK